VAEAQVPALVIRRGLVHVVIAYDIGFGIDLVRCRQSVTDLTELAHIKHKGYAPRYFQFDPLPIRVTQEIAPLSIGGLKSNPSIDVVIYDFGGISISYTLAMSGPMEEWIALSCQLAESSVFLEDSRKRCEHLLAVIESAVENASISDLTEDYLLFQFEACEGTLSPDDLFTKHAAQVARLLRSEHDPLSDQELNDSMAVRVSFGRDDVAIIDWNAALLFDKEPDDVRSVLEFANLQLLEARFLDERLDRALDRSYEVLNLPRDLRLLRTPGRTRTELRRVAKMQVDGAILFERVGNALKLLGDQYLARVYRATSQRYRLAEWNTGILRKLETIESIYEKMHDQSTNLRMEVLEWIIILLIAFEIVLSLISRAGH
jgi:hypothetical protein